MLQSHATHGCSSASSRQPGECEYTPYDAVGTRMLQIALQDASSPASARQGVESLCQSVDAHVAFLTPQQGVLLEWVHSVGGFSLGGVLLGADNSGPPVLCSARKATSPADPSELASRRRRRRSCTRPVSPRFRRRLSFSCERDVSSFFRSFSR